MRVKYNGIYPYRTVLGVGDFPKGEEVKIDPAKWDRLKNIEGFEQIGTRKADPRPVESAVKKDRKFGSKK